MHVTNPGNYGILVCSTKFVSVPANMTGFTSDTPLDAPQMKCLTFYVTLTIKGFYMQLCIFIEIIETTTREAIACKRGTIRLKRNKSK